MYDSDRDGERRTSSTRRSGPIRREERRTRVEDVETDRRSGRDRRRIERRSRADRRGTAAAKLSPRDRSRARLLPDEIAESKGTVEQRVPKVIRHLWPVFPLPLRAGLAEALLPLMEPVVNGGPITDQLRSQCEELVAEWIGKHR